MNRQEYCEHQESFCYPTKSKAVILLIASLLLFTVLGMGRKYRPGSLRFRRDVKHKGKNDGEFTFPDSYHAVGVLQLPYGNIAEPFDVWYSGKNRMSRIDYYGGESLFILTVSFVIIT